MRQECIQAVAQAIGRNITVQEAKDIENRIVAGMTKIARDDPTAWHGLTREQRLRAAADYAGQQLLEQAGKKKQRIALTILAHDRTMSRYEAGLNEGLRPFQSVARVLNEVSTFTKGVSNEYFSRLIDTMEAIGPKWLGMVENAHESTAVVREIFGEHSGSPTARKAAKAWLDTVESMRQRFNAAGGDVGKLDYGYLPQPHDDVRVIRAGAAQWSKDILPLLDRSRYVDANGNRLDDGAIMDMLGHAYETITTGGLNKLQPGRSSGNGMRANRGNDHRVIHFKDAESYLAYAAKYNKGGILSAMQGHVARLAKDIAMVEQLGPNSAQMFQFLHDTATKTGDSDMVGTLRVRTWDMWSVLNGTTGTVVNPRLADFMQGWRNLEVAGKLGSALISSINDIPTYFATTGFNRIGYSASLVNLVRSFGSETTEYANRAGLVAESMISDMNRWAESNVGRGWTAKLANATMKASLLEGWTDAIRRGMSLSMMGAIGKLTDGDWAALHESDRGRMQARGITEQDFNIWKLATQEDWNGSRMLTLSALRSISEADLASAGFTLRQHNQAVSKFLGMLVDESEFASLGQNLETRAAVTRSTQKGTVEGEFLRAITLFKGFPLAMISRHWGRTIDAWRMGDKASSVAYAAGLTTALTIFGGIAMELKDLVAGKDPRDATTPKFWGAAFAQGGGWGIFGDILYTNFSGDNRAGVPNWLNFAGPQLGSAFELMNTTFGNLGEALRGKETHAGAETVRFLRSHLPFVNLWYAKAALDHAVLHDLQEYLSPGYLARMRQRAHDDWNQDYWWQPGQTKPSRGPELKHVLGN